MVRCQPLGFCQSAPTDGRDANGNIAETNVRALTSKQNSDAHGMYYQWGRKDPFLFATNSELWGVSNGDCGKHAVKIYTIDGVLIYQESNGSSNADKLPVGGVMNSSGSATSMMLTIKNPITFFEAYSSSMISQIGHTRSLWDHYWTSYSRGIDGRNGNVKWHNDYLDGYTAQRAKSIYDPCPYGFRIATDGTYNQISSNSVWMDKSYSAGVILRQDELKSWYLGLGNRYPSNGQFTYCGFYSGYWNSTIFDNYNSYYLRIQENSSSCAVWMVSHGYSVRCIEGLCSSVRSDRRTRRKWQYRNR